MRKLLQISFHDVWSKFGLVFFLYVLGLLIAGYPVILFYRTLVLETGNSAALNELVPAFDFTIFADFMNQSGESFRSVFRMALLLGFLGSIVFTFFSGGVIGQLASKSRTDWNAFFRDSKNLFIPYFVLLLIIGIFLFVIFLVSGLIFFIFVILAEGSSERGYFFWLLPPSILLIIGFSYGLVVSFYAKVMLYQNRHVGVSVAFWKAVTYVYKRPKLLVYFWSISLAGVILTCIYLIIEKYLTMSSTFTIVLVVIVQQLNIMSRFFLKNWNYATALNAYGLEPVYFPEPKPDVIVMEESDDSENTEEA